MKSDAEIRAAETDLSFWEGMCARMVMSWFKYGDVAEGAKKIDAIKSALVRLDLYQNGDPAKNIPAGNRDYLMDAANFCMIEFMYPNHPQSFFHATDDDGSPGRVSNRTGKLDKRDNEEIGAREGVKKSSLSQFR